MHVFERHLDIDFHPELFILDPNHLSVDGPWIVAGVRERHFQVLLFQLPFFELVLNVASN